MNAACGGSGGDRGGGGWGNVPTTLNVDRQVDEEDSNDNDDDDHATNARRNRRVPYPVARERRDDVPPGPSTFLQPNIEDILPGPILRVLLWLVVWVMVVTSLWYGIDVLADLAMTFATMMVPGILFIIAVVFCFTHMPTAFKGKGRARLTVIEMRKKYYLVTGYNPPNINVVKLVRMDDVEAAYMMYGVPSISLGDWHLQATPLLHHMTASLLKSQRAVVHDIPEPPGFVNGFVDAQKWLKLFEEGQEGYTHENSGLLPGRALPLLEDEKVRVTALTEPFGPTNSPKFIGRKVLVGGTVLDPQDVTLNSVFTLNEIDVRDEGSNHQLLSIRYAMRPRRPFWYHRECYAHFLTRGFTNIIASSYEACFDIFYEIYRTGGSDTQVNLVNDLVRLGISQAGTM